MHILYLHQYFASREGDYSTRSYEFARRLIARGHQVTMLASPAFLPPRYHSKKTEHVVIDDIPVTLIPVAWSNSMSYLQRVQAIIRFAVLATWYATRVRADVVYVSSPPITIAVAGLAAKLLHRIPMIFEVRDLWPEVPIAIGALNNSALKWLVERFTQFVYKRSAHIVALSPSAADVIAQRGVSQDKISVIPNCSDIDLFDVSPEQGLPIRQQLNLQESDCLLVYTGALGFTHGVDYLVDLAVQTQALNSNVRFLVVGKGKMREQILDKARAAGILDRTFWIWEPLPKTEIPAVFAAADAILSTTINVEMMKHNSANKFFDGLAARKPIIINYGGWQADLLVETGAGIALSPSNPHESALQLIEFLNDPVRLRHASEAAYMLAQSRFNRDQLTQQLEDVLIQVAQE